MFASTGFEYTFAFVSLYIYIYIPSSFSIYIRPVVSVDLSLYVISSLCLSRYVCLCRFFVVHLSIVVVHNLFFISDLGVLSLSLSLPVAVFDRIRVAYLCLFYICVTFSSFDRHSLYPHSLVSLRDPLARGPVALDKRGHVSAYFSHQKGL